uniref:Ubiquitin-related modifier 1 homolog n=1 Tax=Heterorhabditis bacteriophora TaxID=37862 RepID=A0A1I7WJ44_HETBA
MTGAISVTIEFSGGSEFLVGNQKEHSVQVPLVEGKLTVTNLLEWIRDVLLKDCDRPELLLDGNTVRPGVLVLINECDWELMDKAETHLKGGDVITFISTLHGGECFLTQAQHCITTVRWQTDQRSLMPQNYALFPMMTLPRDSSFISIPNLNSIEFNVIYISKIFMSILYLSYL